MSKSREPLHHIRQTRVTLGCFILLCLSVAAYLYFLNLSVMEVVIREDTQRTQQELQTEIAQLEAEYIVAQHEVSSRIAQLDGYQTNTPKVFIDRAAASLAFERQ